jgi:futalosine hydrolase
MKIIIFSATAFEIAPLKAFLLENFVALDANSFLLKTEISIELAISGVGLPISMHCFAQKLNANAYTHALQIGIAGAFAQSGLTLGEVVAIQSDAFADIGAEEIDGRLLSAFDLGFADANAFPFQNGRLQNNDFEIFTHLKKANAISLNTASGTAATILRLTQTYPDAHTESMEGAAFMYAALCAKVPNIAQIRGISNFVTPRNRADWQIPLAIANSNAEVMAWIAQIL